METDTSQAPVGGFGRLDAARDLGPPPRGPGDVPRWVVIALGAVILALVAVGTVFGLRRYVESAKTAEAQVGVMQIAVGAAQAYERDGKLCPSVLRPVPADRAAVAGKKHQTMASEWRDARFDCVGFEIAGLQYYRYDYQAYGDRFEAIAEGDLDGDGTWEIFVMRGEVVDGKVKIVTSRPERRTSR
ncbi:MAG: hypothetical protein JNL38_24570 [Myxococcales bacterium]|nr:hypothetical protein [Myxococcales bacterium]